VIMNCLTGCCLWDGHCTIVTYVVEDRMDAGLVREPQSNTVCHLNYSTVNVFKVFYTVFVIIVIIN